MVFEVVFIPNRTKTTLVCVLSMENNYLKKCIPFTPKRIKIEIENRVFREINRAIIFRQNRTALLYCMSDVYSCCFVQESFFNKITPYLTRQKHRRAADRQGWERNATAGEKYKD